MDDVNAIVQESAGMQCQIIPEEGAKTHRVLLGLPIWIWFNL